MKYVSADEAVKLVRSGDSICCQGGASVPVLLQEALARRHAELRDVTITSGFNVHKDPAPFCKPEYKDSFLVNSIFLSADQRKHVAEGYGSMTPAFLGEVPALFRSGEFPVDVAFITCSLPDENGYCSYGISADIAVSAAEVARDVIALVSPNIPYLYGDCLIHESKISAAVLCDVAPFAMTFGEPTPIEAAIGANVASKIPDGACLQIGVGGIPNAILNGIKHHQHLGLHTEAMTDGVIRLIKEGVIDNSLKKVHPGVSIAQDAVSLHGHQEGIFLLRPFDPAGKFLLGDLLVETVIEESVLTGVHDIPHFRLAVLAFILQGIAVVRMDLDGQVVPGVNEFDQNRKFTKSPAMGSQDIRTVQIDVFFKALSGKFAVGNDAGTVGMAGQFPGFRQDISLIIHVVLIDQAMAAPEIIFTCRY